MLTIKNNTQEAFTIPKFHKNKAHAGKIKAVDLKYDEIGEICSGEILFVLEEDERKK